MIVVNKHKKIHLMNKDITKVFDKIDKVINYIYYVYYDINGRIVYL
jgi:hypothetical protein